MHRGHKLVDPGKRLSGSLDAEGLAGAASHGHRTVKRRLLPNLPNRTIVALVSPPQDQASPIFPPFDVYAFPYGLACISSVLKRAGYHVLTVNGLLLEHRLKVTLEALLARDCPHVFCTGGMSCHWKQIDRMLRIVSRAAPHVVTVLGGPIITADWRLAMGNLRCDIGVIGEGEDTILELLTCLAVGGDLRAIRGIAFRPAGVPVRTQPRLSHVDLDTLPIPDYAGFEFAQFLDASDYDPVEGPPLEHARTALIHTSRSCPYRCTFCYHPLGNAYRTRSLARVFDEIRHLVEHYSVNSLYIEDELFSASTDRMLRFAEKVAPLGLKWACQMRPGQVDGRLLRILRRSGLHSIGYGIEHICDSVLTSMRKQLSSEIVVRALRTTHAERIAIQGNIMWGDAAETEATFTESFEWIRRNKDLGVFFTMLRLIPSSQAYVEAVRRGAITDKLRHVLRGCPPVRICAISRGTWARMQRLVMNLCNEADNFCLGMAVEARQVDDSAGRLVYAVKARCPHCGHVSAFSRLHCPLVYRLVVLNCHECRGRYAVRRSELDAVAPNVDWRSGAMREVSGHLRRLFRMARFQVLFWMELFLPARYRFSGYVHFG